MREDIRRKIINHLKLCQGNAVIVFDEVQKIVPGVLEVLLPMLNERGSVQDLKSTNNMEYSTTNCVFIFISDIAADIMIKLLLTHGTRSRIPQSLLRKEVKLALDSQWHQQGFGKLIHEVVPFFSLEQEHLFIILKQKFHLLSLENRFLYWSDLVIDDDVIAYLVGKIR